MVKLQTLLVGAFLFLAPAVLAQNEGLRDGDCCDVTGRGSGHIFGMIMIVIFGLAFINILKTTPGLENAFVPGTSSYCRRMLFNEFFHLALIIYLLYAPGDEVDEDEENAYTALAICNAVVILFLIVYWSKPCQKMNIFLGNPEDRGKRKALTNAIKNARTTITGRKLISDSLRAEVEGFNARMVQKHKMARTMALHVAFFKIFDIVLIGIQYANVCEKTLCSFWKQLGTLFLIPVIYINIEDVYRMRTATPKVIDLKKEEGRGKASFKEAKMKPIEAYNLVRDLIYEIVEVGKYCSYVLATDNEFRSVTLQIHDWETNPERDPRIDSCMWCASYSMALSNAMLSNRHLSVTALHLANAAMKNIRAELLKPQMDRVKLLRSVAALYQTSFHSLPEEDKEWLYENIAIWAEEAKTLDDPMQYTVLFLGQILPDGYDSPESVRDAVESLTFFYDDVTRDLLSGRDISILDDASMEWANMTWALLKVGFDSREEVNQISAYLEALLVRQNPVILHEACAVLADFQRRLVESVNVPTDLLLGGLVTRFEDLLNKAEGVQKDAENGPRRLGDGTNVGSSDGTADAWIQRFIDVAGSKEGSLTRAQFRKLYLEFGVKPTPLELNRYFADEKLDYDEFYEFVENHNYGGWRQVVPNAQADTIVPSVSTDRVPKELVRVRNVEGADEFAPLSVKALADRLNEDLDVRSFSPENHLEIRASVTSPLLKNKQQTRGGRSGSQAPTRQQSGGGRELSKRASNVMKKKSSGGKKGVDLSPRAIKNFFLDNTLYMIVVAMYSWTGINSIRHVGNDDVDDVGTIAFLGIPPTYIYTDAHTPYFVPFIYFIMHMTLFTFGMLPLTMSRWTIRQLSEFETLGRFFRIEHAYFWHRRLGYDLSWGILTGGTVWWLTIMYQCTEEGVNINNNDAVDELGTTNRLRCEAFFPNGRYFDFYVNAAAVVFLRELVITSLSLMVTTSGLIFERSIPWKGHPIKVHKAYEVFYYSHLLGAYAIAVLALTSRWDVFYPTIGAWSLYVFDVVMMYSFNTHPTRVAGANCFTQGSKAVVLKLRKPERFEYKAGQTCFIKIPRISWLEWHPFSIASSPLDENVEFVIDCGHGEGQWTDLLFKACEDRGSAGNDALYKGGDASKTGGNGAHNLTAFLYGPSGSSFQSFDEHKGIMLIGGGSGLPSSLSVIRHIFYVRKGPNRIKASHISFVWTTRSVESLLWCWDHLKSRIEAEVGYERRGKWTPENDEALAELSTWLEVSINVTQMTGKNLNDLIEIEKTSQVGSWMVHHLASGRIANWKSVLQRFHATVGSDEIKVFFCGPPALAAAIRKGAKEIEGFNVDVSSENFHDS